MLQNGSFFKGRSCFFLEQSKKRGRKQTTNMNPLINKKLSLPKPYPQVSSPPLSDLEQRMKLISGKLDDGNVKGGIRLAASDDEIAPFQLITITNFCLRTLSEPNLQLQIQSSWIVEWQSRT